MIFLNSTMIRDSKFNTKQNVDFFKRLAHLKGNERKREWDNCNSLINKICLKIKVRPTDLVKLQTYE